MAVGGGGDGAGWYCGGAGGGFTYERSTDPTLGLEINFSDNKPLLNTNLVKDRILFNSVPYVSFWHAPIY